MKAKDIEILIYNPIYLSRILQHFLSGAHSINSVGVKSELIYLAVPCVLELKLRKKLSNLNKNSTINSIIKNPEFELFFSQINTYIENTKHKTKGGLIVLGNTHEVAFCKFIGIDEKSDYKKESNPILKEVYKASYILGSIIAKENYLTVIKKFGITQL